MIIISIFLMGSGDVDPTESEGIGLIKEVIQKYNATSALKMGVKKEVWLSLMEETKKSQGRLYFSKGLLRLEIVKPEKSTIILNDDAVWVETSVNEQIHVTKIASKDLKKRSKAPLVLLLTETDAWDRFKVTSSKDRKLERRMILEPKKEGEYPELSKVEIAFNTKNKELWLIAYEDEIENKVTYKFHRPDFDAEVSQSKFKYKPPKGAEVVEY